MLYKKEYRFITLIFISYMVVLLVLHSQLNHSSIMSGLWNSKTLNFDAGKRNAGHHSTILRFQRLKAANNTLSMEAEVTRRMLYQDEQELWNFLAAQLQLHSGHFIDRLPAIENVITSLLQYKSVLNEDLQTYKTKLEADTSGSATTLLSFLTRVNISLTKLFNETQKEWKNSMDSNKRLRVPSFSKDMKLKVRYLHIKVRSLLHQLVGKTSQEFNWSSQSMELGNKIQKQIYKSQNPRNCSSARKLVCGVCNRLSDCGFGCFAHQIGLCLVTAYLSNRTMILDCSVWRYSSKGWFTAFLPITNCTKTHIQEKSIQDFRAARELPAVLNQDILNTVRMNMPVGIPGTGIFPPAVPRDILQRILRFNSHPPSWWMGQFKLWAMRLNDDMTRDVNKHFQRQNITGTIVGLHVRRTDKTREAAYHALEEYMVHVVEWYDSYELSHPNIQRKVYLATDEQSIIKEAKRRYPKYTFIHDQNISSSAALKSRYNEQSLRGIVKDIYSLVRCDFVVCTFSSQLCRLVYELSQSLHGEIHGIQSLDDMYFIGGESIGQGRVRRDHIPVRQNEIHVQRGDLLEYHGNHWDGYVLVTDLKNRKTGLIPAFKLERVYKMHNYSSKV